MEHSENSDIVSISKGGDRREQSRAREKPATKEHLSIGHGAAALAGTQPPQHQQHYQNS